MEYAQFIYIIVGSFIGSFVFSFFFAFNPMKTRKPRTRKMPIPAEKFQPFAKQAAGRRSPKVNDDDYGWRKENDLDLREKH